MKSRCLEDIILLISFPTYLCTKLILGREKAVKTRLRHFKREMPCPSKTLFKTRKGTYKTTVLTRVLLQKNSPAAGFTVHVLTRFRRVLAARA